VLENREKKPRSDLCSLGYVLIELLAGRQPFAGIRDHRELQEAKRLLPLRLPEILPDEVLRCELLCSFIKQSGLMGAILPARIVFLRSKTIPPLEIPPANPALLPVIVTWFKSVIAEPA
jgi:serine/threonine protein kinase